MVCCPPEPIINIVTRRFSLAPRMKSKDEKRHKPETQGYQKKNIISGPYTIQGKTCTFEQRRFPREGQPGVEKLRYSQGWRYFADSSMSNELVKREQWRVVCLQKRHNYARCTAGHVAECTNPCRSPTVSEVLQPGRGHQTWTFAPSEPPAL
ncbi:hypothetical protein OE88DRAFT_326689 [Heliocybe sulcata]|uniref:Uncharacterized protein n=1 Tax=Heliocybe sulcata TaxID=5364 RepID=A0A5C3MXU3_9AGAM|nr:hypothetical protein OE88DRAFT_326689 [Heliocybe sulcata]